MIIDSVNNYSNVQTGWALTCASTATNLTTFYCWGLNEYLGGIEISKDLNKLEGISHLALGIMHICYIYNRIYL